MIQHKPYIGMPPKTWAQLYPPPPAGGDPEVIPVGQTTPPIVHVYPQVPVVPPVQTVYPQVPVVPPIKTVYPQVPVVPAGGVPSGGAIELATPPAPPTHDGDTVDPATVKKFPWLLVGIAAGAVLLLSK